MASKIKIYNQSRVLQIDSDYMNLGLRFSGSIVANAGMSDTGWGIGLLTVPYSPSQVLAWSCTSYTVMALHTFNGDGTVTYRFFTQTNGNTIQYRVFDNLAYLTPSGSVGIRIFKPGGGVGFDSRYDYMRVIGTNNGSESLVTNIDRSQTYSGTVPFVASCQLRYEISNVVIGIPPPVYQVDTFWRGYAARVNGAQIDYASLVFEHVAGPYATVPNDVFQPGYNYMVLDCNGM